METPDGRKRRLRGVTEGVQIQARVLRKQMTLSEQILWNALRVRFPTVRVRRQHPVDRFILDFYVARYRLAIEVDGDIHDQQQERDDERTARLETQGIRVVRFRNEEIASDLESVLASISAEFK